MGFWAIFRSFLSADVGRLGEAAAARYLRRQGLRIVARNWRARSGEIDIIAWAGDTLVFVEVKSRSASDRGDPLERVSFAKVRRIRRAARSYQRRMRGRYLACRLDAVVVEFASGFAGRPVPASIRWHPNLLPLEPDG